MIILGIDPGSVSAAYALLDTENPFDNVTACDNVPTANKQVDANGFYQLLLANAPDVAIIETVGAMPKQGVSSAFRFGVGVGLLRGVVQSLNIPLHEVAASKWKKHFGLNSDAEKSRARAIAMFPGANLKLKKDHNKAEALLLALYFQETSK
jgi:crossover junction endodeoxyribonuclease RuvC